MNLLRDKVGRPKLKRTPFIYALFGLSLSLHSANAANLSYQGSVSFERRQYEGDDNDENFDSQTSIKGVFSGEMERQWGLFRLGALFRDAYQDQSRDFFNLDETYVKIYKNNFSASLGTHVFNWRVLEVFSAVDTINPRNFDNMDEAERLGLQSLVLAWEFETSFVQFIALPRVQPPLFAQGSNRQGLQVDLEAAKFVLKDNQTGAGDQLFQYIARFKKTFELLDLDVHFARKFDTAFPLVVIDKPAAISPGPEDLQVRPYFFPVTQYGLAAQGNYGEWLLKLEAARYDFDDHKVEFFVPFTSIIELGQKDHSRIALGVERVHYFKNNHSGTFYVEYMSVLEASAEEAKTLGAFQRDGVFGYRHAFNDFKGNEISFFIIHDLQDYNGTLITGSHKFRLNNAWKLGYSVTVIEAPKPDQNDPLEAYYGLKPLRESDNILVTLTRFF